MNLGVDAFSEYVIPEQLRPGIGLRPGGERPDLEEQLPVLFDALYAAVIGVSRLGLHVVVDVGHHDDYSTPLGILGRVARQLAGSPRRTSSVCGAPSRSSCNAAMPETLVVTTATSRAARTGPSPTPSCAGNGPCTIRGSTTSRSTPQSVLPGSAWRQSGLGWTKDPRRRSRSWRTGLPPDGGRQTGGVLLIDAANVVGSRPDGWWRDRAGAARAFLERVRAAVRAGRLARPVVVVLEGKAREGAEPSDGRRSRCPSRARQWRRPARLRHRRCR